MTLSDLLQRTHQQGDCLIWEGARTVRGYPAYSRLLVHRIVWQLVNGPIPPGDWCVCHSCDTPLCVSPAHLFLGSRGDNNRDRHRKGRDGSAKGERHGRSKLTSGQVSLIRARLDGGEPLRQLAREYGVSRAAVQFIKRGVTWAYPSAYGADRTPIPDVFADWDR